jgi:archaellum component FlaG (FlaF/FlaG flagellin family)
VASSAAKDAGDAAKDVGKAAGSAGKAVASVATKAAGDVASAATAAAKGAADGAKAVAGAASSAAGAVAHAAESINDVNKTLNQSLPAINVVKPAFTILDQNISCPLSKDGKTTTLTAAVKATMDVDIHVDSDIGAIIAGTIIPPKISDFALFAGLNADMKGDLNMSANVAGTLNSPRLTIFEIGIPGLDFPGILTIGPSFQVTAGALMTLDLDMDFGVSLDWSIKDGQFFFPSSDKHHNTGTFGPSDSSRKSPTCSRLLSTDHLLF